MSAKDSDANEEAMQRAKRKLEELTGKGADPSPEGGEQADHLFPDSPEEKPDDITEAPPEEVEPTSEPLPAKPFDATLGFSCSIHGPQPLKEIRYTTIILACGCEWIYDCGHLSQSRRGPE